MEDAYFYSAVYYGTSDDFEHGKRYIVYSGYNKELDTYFMTCDDKDVEYKPRSTVYHNWHSFKPFSL